MRMFFERLGRRIGSDLSGHSQVHEQCGGRGIATCSRNPGAIHRRKPQQHEFSVAFNGFDLPAREMLFKRSRVIDEIRFSQPHGQNSPAHNCSPQPARYCFDFRKFWHEGIANKIAHPIATTQASDTNPKRSATCGDFFESLLLIIRGRRRSGDNNRMRL